MHEATGSPIAAEALRRIAELYAIEASIRGRTAGERQSVRNIQSRPLEDLPRAHRLVMPIALARTTIDDRHAQRYYRQCRPRCRWRLGLSEDPVKLGLVASLARSGGNLTGINFFSSEYNAKRLALLHDLVPEAVRIAVLVNPANVPATESTLRDIPEAARAMGLQIQVLNASTRSEIEAAFATLARDRAEATLAASYRIPASYPSREAVEAGLPISDR